MGNWYMIEKTPRKKQNTVGIDQGLLYVPSFFGVNFKHYLYGLKMVWFSLPAFVRFKVDMCHDTED